MIPLEGLGFQNLKFEKNTHGTYERKVDIDLLETAYLFMDRGGPGLDV